MSIRWIAGVLGDGAPIPPEDLVNLVDETFQAGFGTMVTPGNDEPADAWSRGNGATPTGSTGPAGGADPTTRAVNASLFYAFCEGTPAGGGIGPQRTYTMETREFDADLVGLSTLTFDLHMRFGSQGGLADGTLFIEGWDGSAWSTISNPITGSKQIAADAAYLPSTNFGTYTSSGFSNADFKFRFRMVTGAQSNNYDAAVDNIRVVGPGGDITPPPPPPPTDNRSLSFNTGLRRLHMSPTGAPPIDGTIVPQALSFTSLQAALNALQAGDVLTIGDGVFTGSFTLNNKPGSTQNPIWIAAENPGQVVISNYLQAPLNGNEIWQSDGDGIFSIEGSYPYYAADRGTGDFLPIYREGNLGDINAASIPTTTGPNSPSGSILKPQSGFTVTGGRIRLKLRDAGDPTGRNIAITNGFSRTQMTWDNVDNTIIDGIVFEGAGDAAAFSIQRDCANPEVRNCVFEGCQFGVRATANNTLLFRCEYFMLGMAKWGQELTALNGTSTNGAFRYSKNYANAGTLLLNSNNQFDAIHEGGLDVTDFETATPATGIIIEECYMHDCFEGCKAGRHRGAVVRRNVFEACLDDAVEWEGGPSSSGISGTGQFHDNLVRNCHACVSYQGAFTTQRHRCYRNVFVIDDLTLVHPAFMIKTIRNNAAPPPNTIDVDIYQNLFINPSSNADQNDGFGDRHWVWFNFSNSSTDDIANFRNNCVVFVNDLDGRIGNASLPNNRFNNVVVSPSNNLASQDVQGTNGAFVASQAALLLNSEFVPQPGSPLIGAGSALPGSLPDTRPDQGSSPDVGPFQAGETPGPDWPRVAGREFATTIPQRWTSPGI